MPYNPIEDLFKRIPTPAELEFYRALYDQMRVEVDLPLQQLLRQLDSHLDLFFQVEKPRSPKHFIHYPAWNKPTIECQIQETLKNELINLPETKERLETILSLLTKISLNACNQGKYGDTFDWVKIWLETLTQVNLQLFPNTDGSTANQEQLRF